MAMLLLSTEVGKNTSRSSSLQQAEGMVSNTLGNSTHVQTLLSPDRQPA